MLPWIIKGSVGFHDRFYYSAKQTKHIFRLVRPSATFCMFLWGFTYQREMCIIYELYVRNNKDIPMAFIFAGFRIVVIRMVTQNQPSLKGRIEENIRVRQRRTHSIVVGFLRFRGCPTFA